MYRRVYLPIILIDGAHTSTAFCKSSLRTQWYWMESQPGTSLNNDEQFLFIAAISYEDWFDGHFDTNWMVCRDTLHGFVNAFEGLNCKKDICILTLQYNFKPTQNV